MRSVMCSMFVRGLALLAATLGALSACVPLPSPWTPADRQLLAPRDSAALARETGRRDAHVLQRPSAAGAVPVASTVAVTLGLFLRRPGGGYWIAPVTIASVSTAGALWAYRETKRPIPAPPDSMRSRYGLADDRLWQSYGDGFREQIDDQRRNELSKSTRSAFLTTFVFAGTYAALHRR